MSLEQTISTQIKDALKSRDTTRVSTLRLLSNALHNEKIAKQADLTEEDETTVLQRQIKQRKESIEAYTKGGRQELADKEQKELEILQEFLPEQVNEAELEKIITDTIAEVAASSPQARLREQDFGRVMGRVMSKVKGQATGDIVAQVVKQKLTN